MTFTYGNVLKSFDFRTFSRFLAAEKFEDSFCNYPQNSLTHNRIAPSGQSNIFQNTMSNKSEKRRNFQNFLKGIFLRPPGAALDAQNLSQCHYRH